MKAEEDYSHGAQRLASATLGVSPGDEGLEQPSARRPARRVRRTRVLCGAGMAKYMYRLCALSSAAPPMHPNLGTLSDDWVWV
jgi:hypothetical protein